MYLLASILSFFDSACSLCSSSVVRPGEKLRDFGFSINLSVAFLVESVEARHKHEVVVPVTLKNSNLRDLSLVF